MPQSGRDARDRLDCLAHGCGRSIGKAAWQKRFGDIDFATADYICQKHWSCVPERMRKAYARVRRRERRYGVRLPASSRLWRRILREIADQQTSH